MIKGIKKSNISVEDILNKVSSYDIFKMCLGDFPINKPFSSPFRKDIHPSMIVRFKNNHFSYIDFGNSYYRGDCFDCVMQTNNCDFKTALQIIDKYFNLGVSIGETLIINKNWETPKKFQEKKPILIQFEYGKFTKKELDYWKKLKIGEQELKKNNIYSPKKIYINRQKITLSDLTFIYHYPEDVFRFKEGSVAIYKPFADKSNKWFKNTSFNYVEYLEKIRPETKAFLCPSKKETLFLRNILQTDSIATLQAENPMCFSKEAENVFENIKDKYFIANQDKSGKKFSWYMTKNFNFKHINPKDELLQYGCTDFADVAMKLDNGYNLIIEHFKNKNII